jgi:hypothetical protein
MALDLHISTTWNGATLFDSLAHWTQQEHTFKLLPLLIIWYIWLTRNNLIFENTSFTVNIVVYKTIGLLQLWRDTHPISDTKKILINPHISEDTTTGWFDGAAQGNGNLCGVGGIIK